MIPKATRDWSKHESMRKEMGELLDLLRKLREYAEKQQATMLKMGGNFNGLHGDIA